MVIGGDIMKIDVDVTNLYKDIIEELGDKYAWEMCFNFAGQRLYIPKKLEYAKNNLFKSISSELAEFLIYRYAGDVLSVPLGANSHYKKKQLQADILFEQGLTHNQIAAILQVSYSSARRYKNNNKILHNRLNNKHQ